MVTKAMLNELVEAGIPGPINSLVEIIWAALEPDRIARQAKDDKIEELDRKCNDGQKLIAELKHRLDDQGGRLQNQRKTIHNKDAEIALLQERIAEKNDLLDTLEEDVKNLTQALEETKKNCEAWRRFALPGEVQDDDAQDELPVSGMGVARPLTEFEREMLDDPNWKEIEQKAAAEIEELFAGPGEVLDADFTVDRTIEDLAFEPIQFGCLQYQNDDITIICHHPACNGDRIPWATIHGTTGGKKS